MKTKKKLQIIVTGTNTKVEEVIQKVTEGQGYFKKRKTKQKEEYNSFWTP